MAECLEGEWDENAGGRFVERVWVRISGLKLRTADKRLEPCEACMEESGQRHFAERKSISTDHGVTYHRKEFWWRKEQISTANATLLLSLLIFHWYG